MTAFESMSSTWFVSTGCKRLKYRFDRDWCIELLIMACKWEEAANSAAAASECRPDVLGALLFVQLVLHVGRKGKWLANLSLACNHSALLHPGTQAALNDSLCVYCKCSSLTTQTLSL